MKKLVCADEVRAAAEKGQKIFCVDCSTIITPAAKDLAKELGVELAQDLSDSENPAFKNSNLGKNHSQGKSIDRDIIYQIVKAVLSNSILAGVPTQSSDPPFLTDSDPKSGLKIVRGRSVRYKILDTGDPSTNVTYREVASRDDSQMRAGFLTIEKSSFERESCCEEIVIILEGSMSITINGRTYEACQGDVLFVPKDSKATWSSSGYVKLFYAVYQAK